MAAPRTANITITLGGENIICPHSYFSSLEIERTAKDVCDKFTLKVLDSAAFDIEKILFSKKEGNNNIYIEYIDTDMNVSKKLAGYVLSISSSFINNRNMLSLSGYVSTNIKDKFEKYSVSWNVIPKFNMAEVLGVTYNRVLDANYQYDSTLDKLADWFDKYLGSAALPQLINPSKLENNWQAIIDDIFDNNKIYLDTLGNYYVQAYNKDTKGNSNKVAVKSSGQYIIPIKPDKLIKLICCGGKYEDLLNAQYIDYKGTSFYSSDLDEAEWYYIQRWFKKMGKFDGLKYKDFKCDITTDLSEDEFVQTKESFLDFIYNKVLPKCVNTKDENKYTNFYLEFDNDNVYFKRLDASKQYVSGEVPNYTYYSRFVSSDKNIGRMISFSPTLDILTSQITNGTSTAGTSADISALNLIGYSGGNSDTKNTTTTVDSDSSNNNGADFLEGRYAVKWGEVKLEATVGSTPSLNDAEIDIANVFNKLSLLPYRAKATIEGFNTLKPMDTIEITIVPRNDTGEPLSHHTSGMYYILSMTDVISDGKYTSDLSLVKNISNLGASAIKDEATTTIGELKYTVSSYTTNDSDNFVYEKVNVTPVEPTPTKK